MCTPSPPSLIWNFEVDPPIEQDADYEFSDQDRAYIDSQILGTQALALKAYNASSVGTTPVQSILTTSAIQIVCSGAVQGVHLDTSGASNHPAAMPPSPTDGQVVRLKDLTAAGACHWYTTPGQWSVTAGFRIEDPLHPGTFITTASPSAGVVTGEATNGAFHIYEYSAVGATWSLIG